MLTLDNAITEISNGEYKSYSATNFRNIPQLRNLSEEEIFEIEVLANVFPFKVNNYVIGELIDWKNYQNDPIFKLTFPRKKMLEENHYNDIKKLVQQNASKTEIKEVANKIRRQLNPNPGNQMELNVPSVDGVKLKGLQHKYKETVLFFPSQGQTCHAYCTFCFRWPQFVGIDSLKFSSEEPGLLVKYLRNHPEVTDIIFTGGDPMMMNANILGMYIEEILNANLSHINAIRIGTKAFAYWPYRFLSDPDTEQLFELFQKVKDANIHLALMAHFTHPRELSTKPVQDAIKRVINSGIQIRTQSPIIRGINDSSEIWVEKWKLELKLGCIPYYMFILRNTGSQKYFSVPLIKAWQIFKDALQNVSGICRTVRGPIMSCTPGKVEISGICTLNNTKLISLRMIQGRSSDWVLKPFFAEYNEEAIWIGDLIPGFKEKDFFFEKELRDRFDSFISDH